MPPFQDDGKPRERRPSERPRGDDRGRGIAADRHAPAKPERARGGDADTDAREAAGTDVDQDRARAAAVGQRRDHRHQPLGVPAPDHLVDPRDDRAVLDQRDRAGRGRGLDDEGNRTLGSGAVIAGEAHAPLPNPLPASGESETSHTTRLQRSNSGRGRRSWSSVGSP